LKWILVVLTRSDVRAHSDAAIQIASHARCCAVFIAANTIGALARHAFGPVAARLTAVLQAESIAITRLFFAHASLVGIGVIRSAGHIDTEAIGIASFAGLGARLFAADAVNTLSGRAFRRV